MISELTAWYWVTKRELRPREHYFSLSQHPLVSCSSLSEAGFLWDFPPSMLACLLASCSGLLQAAMLMRMRHHGYSISDTSIRWNLPTNFLIIWFLQYFHLLPLWPLIISCRTYIINVSIGTGHHIITFFCIFLLQFSLMVSIHWKKTFI